MKTSLILILSLSVKFGFSQLTSGLIACYPLDCDNAADQTSNALNGTISGGGVACITGHLGAPNTAYHFGGTSSDYIELPATGSSALLKPNNTISVAGWFESDDLGQAYLVYTKNSCSSNFEAYALNFLLPGTFGPGSGGFYVSHAAGSSCSRVQLFQNTGTGGDPVPAKGSWTHVVFCIDPSNITLYINGHLNNSTTHNIPWDYDNTRNVVLGNTNESFTQSFLGSIDNLRFYDRCLNVDEVYDLYTRDPGCKDNWKGANSVGIASYNLSSSNTLSQNVPNPFTYETRIDYSIPATVTNASIEVYDLVGKKMATYPLSVKGESSLKITTNGLAPGVYIYSIMGDGKAIASKRMIIAN